MPDEHESDLDRRVEEDAQRYPRHEDPDAARDDVGLDDERRGGGAEDVPTPGREGRSD